MSDQDIFNTDTNNSQQTTAPSETPVQKDLFSDQLSQITDQDGRQKYDTVEKALAALEESQKFIPTLKQENEQLRLELEKRASVEDVVSKLTQTPEVKPTEEVQLSAEKVNEIVANALSQREVQTVETRNMEQVVNTLNQKFGDKAADAVSAKAKELNIEKSDLQSLAKKSPQAFLAFFGETAPTPTPTTSNTNPSVSPQTKHVAETPKKSVLVGASAQEQVDHWRDIQKEIYAKHNIEN